MEYESFENLLHKKYNLCLKNHHSLLKPATDDYDVTLNLVSENNTYGLNLTLHNIPIDNLKEHIIEKLEEILKQKYQ